MTTPHINAQQNDFAKNILLPGDPLRAKYIAENFLDNHKQVTNVRNMLGFTGAYKGNLVSVMGTGMGLASCSIYVTELIDHYKVKNLVRVGSCGIYPHSKHLLKLKDTLLINGACTDSSINRIKFGGLDLSATANFDLLSEAYNISQKNNHKVHVTSCFSTDQFYNPIDNLEHLLMKFSIHAVEMETAALYSIAMEKQVKALTILTVTDVIGGSTEEIMTPKDRQLSLDHMIYLALEALSKYN